MFSVFCEPIKILCSKQSKFNFWTNYTIKLHCYAVSWHKPPLDDHIFLTSSDNAIRKAVTNSFFWLQVKGGSELFIYGWRSFQEERVLLGWLAGSPNNLHSYVPGQSVSILLSYSRLPSRQAGRLTLADYGWHWLTLADSGWLWLTLADDSQSQPE